jgi:hypothetical protein
MHDCGNLPSGSRQKKRVAERRRGSFSERTD